MSGDAKTRVDESDPDSELSLSLDTSGEIDKAHQQLNDWIRSLNLKSFENNLKTGKYMELKKAKYLDSESKAELTSIQDQINSKLMPYVHPVEKRLELVKWFQDLIQENVLKETRILSEGKTKAETTWITRDGYNESRVNEYREKIKEKDLEINRLRLKENALKAQIDYQTAATEDFKNRFHSLRDEYMKEKEFTESYINDFKMREKQLKRTIRDLRWRSYGERNYLHGIIDTLEKDREQRAYHDHLRKAKKWVPMNLIPEPLPDSDDEGVVEVYKTKSNNMTEVEIYSDKGSNSEQKMPTPTLPTIPEEKYSSSDSSETGSNYEEQYEDSNCTVLENPEVFHYNSNTAPEINSWEYNQVSDQSEMPGASSVITENYTINTIQAEIPPRARFDDFDSQRSDTSSCWISIESDSDCVV